MVMIGWGHSTGMALRMSRKAYRGVKGLEGLYMSDKGTRQRKNTLHIQPILKVQP